MLIFRAWATCGAMLPSSGYKVQDYYIPLKRSSSRVRLHTRPRATYDRAYLVWYAEEGSIAETSVKTLLKSVDFTIFNLTEYMLSTQIKFCHI